MVFTSIRLQHFRSYSDASFEFDPNVNIIVGANAAGKTNLLESILVAAHGSSYRAADADLVGFNAAWARIDAELDGGQSRSVKLQPERKPPKNYIIDGKETNRLIHRHRLPVVLFEPNHLQLLSGQPDLRRQYIDDLLEQTTPGFQQTRLHYRRVLSQRNALLKRPGQLSANELFVWNLRLSDLGGHIARLRAELIDTMNSPLHGLYGGLAGVTNAVTAQYASKLPRNNYETALLHALERGFDSDRRRGFTGYGPHRDDMWIQIDGHSIGDTASRGETRSLVLALKLFEAQTLQTVTKQQPVILLDDVFSELDTTRRRALTGYLTDYQVFITTTEADSVSAHNLPNKNVILLSTNESMKQ